MVTAMESHRLGRDVFVALAALGWADGSLDREEADAIVRTALEEGLELEEIAEVEEATRHPVDLAFLDRSTLSGADRLFVYAVAAWTARRGGVLREGEGAALERLGELLKVPSGPRGRADAIAGEIAELDEGDRPGRHDLKKLRDVLVARLQP